MSPKRNIVLLGFMGTGKSTVARRLAERLDMPLVDMDEELVRRAGKSIGRVFAEDGEPRFRAMERELVQELSQRTGIVVAAGGGVVLDPRNLAELARSGVLICLKAAPEKILERVGTQSHRPLLEGGDKARKILGILESRRALYDAIPNSIDTTELSPEAVADRVAEML